MSGIKRKTTETQMTEEVIVKKCKLDMFKWVIDDFSKLPPTDEIYSPTFDGPVSGTQWCLLLRPDDLNDEKKGKSTESLGIFLYLQKSSGPVDVAFFRIDIINSYWVYSMEYPANSVTLGRYCASGFKNILERSAILEESCRGSFLVDDKLTIVLRHLTIRQYENLPSGRGILSKHQALLDSGEYSDCTLICSDDIEVPACRFLLASQSPVFHAMFKSGMIEAQSGIVEIDDFNSDCMISLVRYTCRGKPSYLDDIVEELLAAADKYQMTELQQICIDNMLNTMGDFNACTRFIIACRHNVVSVKEAAIKFIKESGRELKKFYGYHNLLLIPDVHAELLSALAIQPASVSDAVDKKKELNC